MKKANSVAEGPGGASSLAGSLLGMLDNDDDRNSAANDAAGRAGSSGNADMFKSALGSLMSNKDQVAKEDIDEEGEFPSLPPSLHRSFAFPYKYSHTA